MHADAGPHRLFFALRPDARVRAAIAARSATVGPACAPGGRPTAPDRYHLTLRFLGTYSTVPAALVESAIAAAQHVRAPEFTLVLDRVGSFERNRVWWLGGDAPRLRDLHARLEGALAAAGLRPSEPASFVPHVTLGRGLRQPLRARAIDPLDWPVRDFVLVDSAAGAPAYRIVRHWPLDPLNRG
jgi:2'-5' RNA ligase